MDVRAGLIVIAFGASGALLSTEIFRHANTAISITCVEPKARLAAGLAYGTIRDEHLLDVPVRA